MTPKRSRLIDLDARLYPIEAAELVGINYRKLILLTRFEGFPRPVDGKYVLRDFLAAYMKHVADKAAFNAAAEKNPRKRRIWFTVSPERTEELLRDVELGDF